MRCQCTQIIRESEPGANVFSRCQPPKMPPTLPAILGASLGPSGPGTLGTVDARNLEQNGCGLVCHDWQTEHRPHIHNTGMEPTPAADSPFRTKRVLADHLVAQRHRTAWANALDTPLANRGTGTKGVRRCAIGPNCSYTHLPGKTACRGQPDGRVDVPMLHQGARLRLHSLGWFLKA